MASVPGCDAVWNNNSVTPVDIFPKYNPRSQNFIMRSRVQSWELSSMKSLPLSLAANRIGFKIKIPPLILYSGVDERESRRLNNIQYRFDFCTSIFSLIVSSFFLNWPHPVLISSSRLEQNLINKFENWTIDVSKPVRQGAKGNFSGLGHVSSSQNRRALSQSRR